MNGILFTPFHTGFGFGGSEFVPLDFHSRKIPTERSLKRYVYQYHYDLYNRKVLVENYHVLYYINETEKKITVSRVIYARRDVLRVMKQKET